MLNFAVVLLRQTFSCRALPFDIIAKKALYIFFFFWPMTNYLKPEFNVKVGDVQYFL
jgi:hypothetical protein